MNMGTFARERNFHVPCKDYLEQDTFPSFFDAYSLLAAGIVNHFIIFWLKVILCSGEGRAFAIRNVPSPEIM